MDSSVQQAALYLPLKEGASARVPDPHPTSPFQGEV